MLQSYFYIEYFEQIYYYGMDNVKSIASNLN